MARSVQFLLVILVVTAFFIIVPGTLKDQDYNQLLPVMVNGPLPVLRGALIVLSWLCDLFVITMLHPVIRPGRSPWLINLTILGLIVLFLIGPLIGPVVVFGPEEAARLTLPTFEQIRYITVGNFVERLDSLAIVWWTAGLYARLALYHYLLVLGTAQVVGLREYTALIVPVAVLIGIGTIIVSDNYIETIEFIYHVYPGLNLLICLAVPTLFLALAYLLGWSRRPRPHTKGD